MPEPTPLEDLLNYVSDDILGLDRTSPLASVRFRIVEKDGSRKLYVDVILGSATGEVVDQLSEIVEIDHEFDKKILDVTAKIRDWVNDQAVSLSNDAVAALGGDDRLFGVMLQKVAIDVARDQLVKDLSASFETAALNLTLPELSSITSAFGAAFDTIEDKLYVTAPKTLVNFYTANGIAALIEAVRHGSNGDAYATAIDRIGNGFLAPEIDKLVTALLTDETYEFNTDGFTEALKTAVFDGFLLDDIRDQFFDDFLGLDRGSEFETLLESILTDESRTIFSNALGEIMDFVTNDFSGFDFGDLFNGFDIVDIASKLIGAVSPQDLADIFVDIDSLGEATAAHLGSLLATSILGSTFKALAVDAATALFANATATALATTLFQGLGALFTGGLGMIAGSLVYEALDWITGGWISNLIDSLFGSDSPQVWYSVTFNNGDLVPHLDYSKDSEASQRKAIGDIAEAYADMTSDIVDFVGVDIDSYGGPYSLAISWRMKSFGKNVWIGPENNPIYMSTSPENVARAAVTYTLDRIVFDQDTMRGKAFEIWKDDMPAGSLALATSEAFLQLERYMDRADFAQAYIDNPAAIDAILAGEPSVAQAAFMIDYFWALEHGLFDGVAFRPPTVTDAAPLAHDATLQTGEDGRLIAFFTADGDDLAYRLAQGGGPTHGSVTVTPNGGLIYTPDANYYGLDSFTFLVTDAQGRNSTATVTIAIQSDGRYAVVGTSQGDSLVGFTPSDELFGFAGDDLLNGGGGADQMTGGQGNDKYIVDDAGDEVLEQQGEGIDSVEGSVSIALSANVENLTLTGSGAIDGTGNGLANLIIGNAAANLIDGGAGADTLRGGAGDDRYRVDNLGDVVVEAFAEGADTVESSVNFTLGANLENLTLIGGAAASATGNGLANILVGNSASNVLTGGAGHDRLNGMGGSDIMKGGIGNDTYVVDRVTDVVTEAAGEGTDTVESALTWTLGDNVENLTLTGTAGIRGTGNDLSNLLIGNVSGNRLDGMAGADVMRGGMGNDTYVVDNLRDVILELADEGTDTIETWVSLTLGANLERLTLLGVENLDGAGNAFDNFLTGNGGANRLNGWAGADTMRGGEGHDIYVVDDLGDKVIEIDGEGVDTIETGLSLVLTSNVENLILTGRLNANATGNELANTLTGNVGANRLDGKAGADVLMGGAGNDVYVFDNVGDRAIELDGEGVDRVESSLTVALLAGFVENLTLTGSAAINGAGNGLDNVLIGNGAANQLSGGGGNDRIDGGGGADTMSGGTGDDLFIIDSVGDVVIEAGSQGIDRVESRVSYTLASNIEILQLTGQAATNATGSAQANELYGNAAANRLDGKAGADRMEGGAGDDTYVVDQAGDVVVESANGGVDTVESMVNWVLGANVETLRLIGTANTTGVGNSLANDLYGNGGNNRLDGGGGIDVLRGGLGNDTYVVDNLSDQVIELDGEGVDTIETGLNLALVSNIENLILTGAAAANGSGNALSNRIIGNDAINQLNGAAGDDRLEGMGGDDRLDGGVGGDAMSGGLGNDLYFVDDLADQVTERANEGIDTVESRISLTLSLNVENLRLVGTATNGVGNAMANTLTGNVFGNRLDGGTGADAMAGGKGDDVYVVDNIADAVIENANEGIDTVESRIDWTLAADLENLTLTGAGSTNGVGNALANILRGTVGANILRGGDGDDALYGGEGRDTLVGGSGKDSFFFDAILGPNLWDIITDFNTADDTIYLDRRIFTGLSANGTLAPGAFRLGDAADDADDRILYDQPMGRLLYDADGNGAIAAVEFARITAGTAVSSTDFFSFL